MTAKEYLQKIRTYDILINGEKKERQKIWQEATSISSPLGKEPVQGGGTVSDKVGNFAIKLAVIDAKIEKYTAEKDKRIALIATLEKPLELSVCYKLYVEYVKYPTLAAIADELCYSYQYIKEVHGEALKKLEIR